MNQHNATITRVEWQELFPASIIFRTLPVAASFTVWALALAGVLLSPIGWWLCEIIFIPSQVKTNDPYFAAQMAVHRSPYAGVFNSQSIALFEEPALGEYLAPAAAYRKISNPFWQLLQTQGDWRRNAYWMVGGLWTVLLWSFVGCAIARTALVRLARDESLGIDEAMEFAFKKAKDCVWAMGAPWCLAAVLCIPGLIAGWLMFLPFGMALVGLGWIVMLVIGVLLAAILFGWLLGWPMFPASVSADRMAALDALTRVYSYIFQRPLHFVFYLILAMVFGSLCGWIIGLAANGSIQMAQWSTWWSAPHEMSDRLSPPPSELAMLQGGEPDAKATGMIGFGVSAVRFWNGLILSLAAAFVYGHLWVLGAATFLLLRRDVDRMEMDEVYLPEDDHPRELPPLVTDEQGIPTIQPLGTPPPQALDDPQENP